MKQGTVIARKTAALATVTAASFVVVGCSAAAPTSSPTTTSSPTSSTAAPAECVRMEASERAIPEAKLLTALLLNTPLPAGTCFFAVGATELGLRQPGKISVRIDLTVPNSTHPNDLRPVATDIAHLVKRTDVAQRVAILDVTNWGSNHPPYREILTDESFQEHPWDGTPSREAELATWQVFTPPK